MACILQLGPGFFTASDMIYLTEATLSGDVSLEVEGFAFTPVPGTPPATLARVPPGR
jgi:hypothetical protein